MDYRELTLDDRGPWARLLAASFHRTPGQMEQLLDWFHAGFELVTRGAWDGDRLVAQYNCRILRLDVPDSPEPVLAGMGLNMAVDPDYRGRGLLETVATPVHDEIAARGCIAGVGFSSSGGLAVTQASRSYAYTVLGPMVSTLAVLAQARYPGPLDLTDTWPAAPIAIGRRDRAFVRYHVTPESLRHRYAEHPFRRYRFGVSRHEDSVDGLVIYRHVRIRGVPAAALLAAYGEDVPLLLRRWAGTIRRRRVGFVHVLTSPSSPLRWMLRGVGPTVRLPFSREPYHLIARGLRPDAPACLFDLDRWDCAGGDIL